MARQKNELSAVQLNPVLFGKVQQEIRYFTPDYLATLGRISRTTIYKFNRGIPINARHERELREVLKKAKAIKQQTDKATIDAMRELVEQA